MVSFFAFFKKEAGEKFCLDDVYFREQAMRVCTVTTILMTAVWVPV